MGAKKGRWDGLVRGGAGLDPFHCNPLTIDRKGGGKLGGTGGKQGKWETGHWWGGGANRDMMRPVLYQTVDVGTR